MIDHFPFLAVNSPRPDALLVHDVIYPADRQAGIKRDGRHFIAAANAAKNLNVAPVVSALYTFAASARVDELHLVDQSLNLGGRAIFGNPSPRRRRIGNRNDAALPGEGRRPADQHCAEFPFIIGGCF